LDSTLDQVGSTAPVGVSGVWLTSAPGAKPSVYRAVILRAALTDAIKFAVRITDPLGRTGERFATIASGSINPAPDLSALTVKKVVGPLASAQISFSSSVPLVSPLDGPYVIKVVVTFKKVIFFFPASTRTITLPVGSIPTVGHAPGTAPEIQLVRTPGPGPMYLYTVLCSGNAIGIDVKVTAPDGVVAEQTQVVS
ncbi:MAG: hypothetical protein ABI035_01825, partial [Gemmatimonadaceae bacterium]